MAILKIVKEGSADLRKKSRPVEKINRRIITLLDDMYETMKNANGIGLAAPQVGVLRRVAVVEHEETLYEMINPVIIKSEGVQRRNEACLSVPGRSGDIDRPAYVKVEALNRHGETYTIEGDDLLASALCHELDHLDGVLIVDRALRMVVDEEAG